VDLNEIKNKAKDLIADLTEPRQERETRQDRDDEPAREQEADPAARTDRLEPPAPGVPPSSGYPGELGVPPGVDPREQLGSAGAHRDQPTAPVAGPGGEPGAVAEYGDDGLRTGDAGGGTAPPAEYPGDPAPASDHPHREDLHREDLRRDDLSREDLRRDDLSRDALREEPAGVPADERRNEWTDPSQTGAGPAAAGEHLDTPAGEHGRHHVREDVVGGDPDAPERLVSAERADSYGSRWDEVKGGFVDEPRQAVAEADALVGELLDELGQLFDRQRRSIEHGLDTDSTSTEDLRMALRRYRSFFDRLLSV
jgi:hypothetical protein